MSDAEDAVSEQIVQYKGGERKFEEDKSVTGFSVIPGVGEIGKRAFLGCSNLRSINGVINSNVTKLNEHAFSGCRSLESLEGLPSELEEIGQCAFQDSGLTTLNGLPEVEEIQYGTFADTDIMTLEGLPWSVKMIYKYAFACCPLTLLASLPDSVTTLHPEAFAECNSIQTSLAMGSYSFSSCSTLRSAMYYFQETNRLRSLINFWIASLKRRSVTKLEDHPTATPEFIGACAILLETHWCEIGEIEELICSYLRTDIDETLLERYVERGL